MEENRSLARSRCEQQPLVGRSPAMLEVYKQVARAAATNVPVLITGETGTGKELVARALHQRSPRAATPFVAVNCGAIAESLMESELFGHAQGRFTGASGARRGLFEEASGGTLFLDEIGDVGPKIQAKLLRALQEGEIRRVGESTPVQVDVRVVAATNKDLKALVTRRAGSARTCSTGSTWCTCTCRRCASGARTFRRWRSTSPRCTRAAARGRW